MGAYPIETPQLKQLVNVKTNIGGWFFDCYLRLDHVSKLKITDHPVQTGANVSDHAYLEPRELTIEIVMSDTKQSLCVGQFGNSWSRSVDACNVLRDIQANRVPVSILTRLGRYNNMMLQSLSIPDDYTTKYALKTTATFKELIVAQVKTVKLSAKPQVTQSTQTGTPEVVKPRESILYQMSQYVGG